MHGPRYGTLVDFNVYAAHGWQQAGFPRAVMTFVVQQELAAILSAVVVLLMVDAEPSGNAKWTTMVSSGLQSGQDKALWSSYHNQEFAPPKKFDPDVHLEKALNHLDVLADEIELMQTNPEHMRQYVADYKANTCINYKGDQDLDEEWTTIARSINTEWTNGLGRWHRVVVEARNLKAELAKLESNTSSGAPLTKDADTAMRCYGNAIRDTLKFVVEFESFGLLRSVKVMRYHYLRADKNRKTYTSAESWAEDLDPIQQSDRIMYATSAMADVVGDGFPDGIRWWIGKLRHELRDVPYNKSVENWLSGMALLDELHTLWCWRQIAGHHEPLAESALTAQILARDELPSTFNIQEQRVRHAVMGPTEGDRQCGRLLRVFCELSPPKAPKNFSWPKKTTRARELLAKFWQCVRETWTDRQVKMGRFEAFQAQILPHMSFDLSPWFLSKLQEERRRIECEHSAGKALKEQLQGREEFIKPSWDIGKGEDGAVRRRLPKKSKASRNDASLEERLQRVILQEAPAKDIVDAGLNSSPES